MAKKTEKLAPDGKPLTSVQKRVVDYMEKHGSISAAEAETELHNHRLASTIEVLRNRRGYDIRTLHIDVTNAYGESTWYGRYEFVEEKKNDRSRSKKAAAAGKKVPKK